MALDAQILLSILAHESSSEDISRTLRATPASYSLTLSNGTGANQAQVAWSDSRAATNTPDVIPLASLADDRGDISFTAIKLLYVRNTGSVTIRIGDGVWATGPFVSPGDSPTSILPGGCIVVAAPTAEGYAVVAGDEPTIGILTLTGSSTYDIILIGEGTVT